MSELKTIRMTTEGPYDNEITILVNDRCIQLANDIRKSFKDGEVLDIRVWMGDALESYLDMIEDNIYEMTSEPEEYNLTEYGVEKYKNLKE